MFLKAAEIWTGSGFERADAVFMGGAPVVVPPTASVPGSFPVLTGCVVFPGFCDVHVHLREPGFCYKETMETGQKAAAAGGYTAICAMPNLRPVPDSPEHLRQETAAWERHPLLPVFPYGALTVGEMGEQPVDLGALAGKVIAFSDDGKGIQSESLMRQLMEEAAKRDLLIAAHCEDNALVCGGYIHAGRYAAAHGHRGISSESEWGPIRRDLRLAKETGCKYHVCHISTKESVALLRQAKAEGVNVTCETAPHYLLLTENDLREEGRFKMNPPLRGEDDREALLEGLLDGTIDMLATDHAPHAASEKEGGLEAAAFGIVGLETAFPLLYTHLVRNQRLLTLTRLAELMSINPRLRFSIPTDPGYTVWETAHPYTIDPAGFVSKGRATPFAGETVYGQNLLTVYDGRTIFQRNMHF